MPRTRADKIDDNQKGIVKDLRRLGFSVEPGHDDILVGHNNKTWWFEIKCDDLGRDYVLFSAITEYQRGLTKKYRGQYHIVTNTEQILKILGHIHV
jgi:hypothetical protein